MNWFEVIWMKTSVRSFMEMSVCFNIHSRAKRAKTASPIQVFVRLSSSVIYNGYWRAGRPLSLVIDADRLELASLFCEAINGAVKFFRQYRQLGRI